MIWCVQHVIIQGGERGGRKRKKKGKRWRKGEKEERGLVLGVSQVPESYPISVLAIFVIITCSMGGGAWDQIIG